MGLKTIGRLIYNKKCGKRIVASKNFVFPEHTISTSTLSMGPDNDRVLIHAPGVYEVSLDFVASTDATSIEAGLYKDENPIHGAYTKHTAHSENEYISQSIRTFITVKEREYPVVLSARAIKNDFIVSHANLLIIKVA